MASNPLFMLLCSGEHEKLLMAAMIASIAAVSDRPVQVFVSMNASLAFAKDTPADKRYQGGAFSRLLKEKNAPMPSSYSNKARSSETSRCGSARWHLTLKGGKWTTWWTACSTARLDLPSSCPMLKMGNLSLCSCTGRREADG